MVLDIKNFIEEEATASDIIEIIIACTSRMNWQVGVEEGQEIVRGITIGTQEYMDKYFGGKE